MANTKEAKARIKINKLLEEAGWRFFDDENGSANIQLEPNVKIGKQDIDEFGEDFESVTGGFIDFLLLDEKGFPLVVLEAKSEEKDPLDGKEQARRYAQSQDVRFVILSNGNLHYFWDLNYGNPGIITSFPAQRSLQEHEAYQPDPKKLSAEIVGTDYIAVSQKPDYDQDPQWSDDEARAAFIKKNNLKFLRPYQLNAITSLQEAAAQGDMRYLFEMATGTGKTLTTAAIIKLFLKTENAQRVLFLVDRIELEEQAWKSFSQSLKNDFRCVRYRDHSDDWHKAHIVVSTVQSLLAGNKYQELFSPTDFDLIISDEAHRSISGNSRAVFEYFIGYKLGLTATPKDYLKHIDEGLKDDDPRQWEKRQLLDTYKTFGCESGEPTFRYSLLDGVRDGYLVNPTVVDARTEITTQLLSDEGYAVAQKNDEGQEEKHIFYQRHFERKFFSPKTNRILAQTFIENAMRDPITNEIGKSIIFCVSQNHARKMTHILNQLADHYFPGQYNSDFAVQVTSRIPGAQQMTVDFSNNNLNGASRVLDGYKTSKTRVAVTVSMMTTGYDCQDLLNVGFMRPVFSPSDFVQMKGRGTRPYIFEHTEREQGEEETVSYTKETFKMFDFFANSEYFEHEFNYDEKVELPPGAGKEGIDAKERGEQREGGEVHIDQLDPLKTIEEQPVGVEGMRIDRKLFEKFERDLSADPVAQEKYEEGDMEGLEEYVQTEKFNQPEEYYDLEKLRKSVKVDRRLSLRELIEKAFGGIQRLKSKDELLEDEYEKFVSIHKPDNAHARPIKNFLKAYVTDPEFREIIDSNRIQELNVYPGFTPEDLDALGRDWKERIPEYVKDYVPLNTFMK